jgi:hypothetical protein
MPGRQFVASNVQPVYKVDFLASFLVAQIFPRWNRVADWLREAERFSTAA